MTILSTVPWEKLPNRRTASRLQADGAQRLAVLQVDIDAATLANAGIAGQLSNQGIAAEFTVNLRSFTVNSRYEENRGLPKLTSVLEIAMIPYPIDSTSALGCSYKANVWAEPNKGSGTCPLPGTDVALRRFQIKCLTAGCDSPQHYSYLCSHTVQPQWPKQQRTAFWELCTNRHLNAAALGGLKSALALAP